MSVILIQCGFIGISFLCFFVASVYLVWYYTFASFGIAHHSLPLALLYLFYVHQSCTLPHVILLKSTPQSFQACVLSLLNNSSLFLLNENFVSCCFQLQFRKGKSLIEFESERQSLAVYLLITDLHGLACVSSLNTPV